MLVYSDGRTLGSVGGGELESRVLAEARQVLQDFTPRLLAYNMSEPDRGDPGVCGGQVEVFLEPIQPQPVLVVVGAGHVGRAVVHLASWLGFRVAVSDDRVEFANPEALPGADLYLPVPLSDLTNHLDINPWTYMILTTRGVDIDVPGLPALLDSPAAFIGVIGSKRRWATTCQQLLAVGVPQEKLDRVRSPVGIEINAETPEEIALSILAEIIQLRRTKPETGPNTESSS
jgi:xanthine dehydrogenase accessory factor